MHLKQRLSNIVRLARAIQWFESEGGAYSGAEDYPDLVREHAEHKRKIKHHIKQALSDYPTEPLPHIKTCKPVKKKVHRVGNQSLQNVWVCPRCKVWSAFKFSGLCQTAKEVFDTAQGKG